MNPTEVLIPIAMFAVIFGIVYISVTSKHRQRMAMIEKGLDPGNLKDRDSGFNNLRNGLFLFGIGLGLFLGHLVARVMPAQPDPNDPTPENPLPYFMMVLLCAGAALIAHHFIVRRKQVD
jgi:hypothetical protein